MSYNNLRPKMYRILPTFSPVLALSVTQRYALAVSVALRDREGPEVD